MKMFDVAIIGSGPAGATTAFKLAESGLSVVIIEKEILPRYKVCGGGLVYRGRKSLEFDLSEVIETEFNTVDVYFSGQNNKLSAKRDVPIISMIMRDKFDELIVKKAQDLGVTLLQDNKVLNLNFDKNITIITDKQEVQAKYLILGDGALSPISKLAGWKIDTRELIPALEYEVEVSEVLFKKLSLEARFDMDFVPKGYAWCFPKKNHLSIGVCRFKREKIDLKKYYQDYLIELGIDQVIKESGKGFQIPISPRTDGFSKNNVFLIGDAAGFADPITAEGISNAIYSGILVAESINESETKGEEAGVLYQNKLEKKLLKELKTAKFLANLFYNKKKIRNYLVSKSGNRFSEYMADIFMGDKTYPKDLVKMVKKKVKESIFG